MNDQNQIPPVGETPNEPREGRKPSRRIHVSTLLLVVVFFIGLCLLLYPTVSDAINSMNQTRLIANHERMLAEMDDVDLDAIGAQAEEYNQRLASSGIMWTLNQQEREIYQSVLDPFGTGMMGSIEIPDINVRLPIYHGVDDAVLQVGIGHMEGTSLPVGGQSTHCVLSGHRGLPSARLFTDLDQMSVGDVFYLHTLNQVLAYQVEDVCVVEPKDVTSLQIEEGKDYCTLVTCTPYGVNTHRLLVRGVRVEYTPEQGEELGPIVDVASVNPVQILPLVVAPLLVILLIWLLFGYRKKR